MSIGRHHHHAPVAILVPVAAATFVTSLDNTVVNVALPSLGRELNLSTGALEWVAASYILSFAALLLVGGTLCDRFGRRRIFLIGLLIFAAGSLLAGAAPDGLTLIGVRAVQGAGAALIAPATLALIGTDLAEQHRTLGVGVWTGSIALALALGPVVGGLLTQNLSWRWIFYLNVPIMAMAAASILRRGVGADRLAPFDTPRGTPVDLAGFVTSAGALALATGALIAGNDRGWTSPMIVACAAGSAVLVGLFVVVERRCDAPMIDLDLFRDRVFSGATVSQMLWCLGLNGVFFFTSLFLQYAMGYSPAAAGLTFLPIALAVIALVPVSSAVAGRFGVSATVSAGLILVAVGLLVVARFNPGDRFGSLVPGLLLIGAGSGLTTPIVAHLLARMEPGQTGSASGIMSAARELSGALGIAVIGAVLLQHRRVLVAQGVDPVSAFVRGYQRGLYLGAALLTLGALVCVVFVRNRTGAVPARVAEQEPV